MRLTEARKKRKRSPMPGTDTQMTMDEEPTKEERLQRVDKAFEGNLEPSINDNFDNQRAYDKRRLNLLEWEEQTSWYQEKKQLASDKERTAAEIVRKVREDERDNYFGNRASEAIPGPETLDMGGQFLTNRERIEGSKIFWISKHMPKGAHLHLHFNAELQPEILLLKAREMQNMFIRSTQPLLNEKDLAETEMVFNVVPNSTESSDVFSRNYNPDWKTPGSQPWMRWSDFCDEFAKRFRSVVKEEIKTEEMAVEQNNFQKNGANESDTDEYPHIQLNCAEKWIKRKMVLSEDEAYGIQQTVNGVWARFNQATRCFKGLLNYKKIFTWYIEKAIDHMIKERIMYAELRPMLMDKSIPSDDGIEKVDHDEQMKLIQDVLAAKKKKLEAQNQLDLFPFGLKIIYCTPRSIPKSRMIEEMLDCIRLKIKYPDVICGFDLVGAEDRPNHIGFYKEELVSFQRTCEQLGLDIPFMFHAGETLLDTGGSKDPANSNLYDAVLLKSKRIGHGFSLVKHPHLIEEFKRKDICIELCPISNELLHLCRNIKEHPYPQLLAAGIPCTVNSDNPSLFSNSLSHEFYQIMVGTPTMNLHGWRQLAEWSIKYSCLTEAEKEKAMRIFTNEWDNFCGWIITEYSEHAKTLR